MVIPSEFDNHSQMIWNWLQTVMDSKQKGFIRLCAEGDLITPTPDAGLGWAALGLKLANMLNLYSFSQPDFKENLVNRVQSFQHRDGKFKGYFIDKAILREADRRRWFFFRPPNMAVRRAETRQAYTALAGAGKKPKHPLPIPAYTEKQVQRYIKNLNWKETPWGAGSQASHLAVFLSAEAETSTPPLTAPMLKAWFNEMNKLLKRDTGSWHDATNELPSHQIINGTMKVYTVYNYLDIAPPVPEKAIDFVLQSVLGDGGCNMVDGLYVLQTATRWTSHRIDEVKEYALAQIERIEERRQPDGAMNYSHYGTQFGYYGANASKGLQGISDLHGTKLFSWAYVLIAEIMGWRKQLGWQIPLA